MILNEDRRFLAEPNKRDGVLMNAIAPGVFRTSPNTNLPDDTPRANDLLMRTPMGRCGRRTNWWERPCFLRRIRHRS
jgi:NAD(P)-dependent dehydrogenase (short-subunit alcohol dehydrogenase family)